MRCLFAVSSWFLQRASLTVNIDLSDVTNKKYTVLYRTLEVYEKKNRSLVFSGSRKIPTLGSTVQWETRQASFPTGTVGPRVGIFLSPLNTNDGFYLSYPVCTLAIWKLLHRWLAIYLQRQFRNFCDPFLNKNKNSIINCEQEKESIIWAATWDFQQIWHFDKCRLGRVSVASF